MTAQQAPVGRLAVCPTPIGNLDDVTLRVLSTLASADVIACEDTRHTGVLLDRHGLRPAATAARRARLLSLHEHNERERARELCALVAGGALVALVSDAGTPLVSDPGFALVRECLAAGLPVEVLPGPSAVTTALVASALPVERWRFVGFLPRSRRELEQLLADTSETLVAFESPRRLASSLAVLAARDPDRPVAVCRELTKLHEEVRRASASELAGHYREHPPRGEVVLVCGAQRARARARAHTVPAERAHTALRELVAAGAKPRPAAAALAKLTGLAANELYRTLTSGE